MHFIGFLVLQWNSAGVSSEGRQALVKRIHLSRRESSLYFLVYIYNVFVIKG